MLRVGVLADLSVENAQIVLRLGILRVECDRRLELSFCFAGVICLKIEESKLIVRRCQVGIQLHGFFKRVALA